jgi:hypothetical protein
MLLVCLEVNNWQCIAFAQEPPVYYQTVSECEIKLEEFGATVANELHENKQIAIVSGQCVLNQLVKGT